MPFTDVLSSKTVSQALTTAEVTWNDRIYTPLVTLWIFLSQVLSQDHSCRGAVARLIAHRVSQGLAACSSRTGAYCQARMRLPEKFFATIARAVGRQLEDQAEEKWLWKGRHVYMFDGSTISMPDTPSNQEAYPQPTSQTPGVGFPLRPKLLQQLLEVCGSIKAKRLLFYLADLAESPWRQFLDRSQIDLGQGHRRLVERGVYVAEYKLTVPREVAKPCV